MATIMDMFNPKVIAANFTEVASNSVPYLGSGFFGPKKKAGLSLSWIVGAKGLPVELKASNFDAKATFRDHIGVDKITTEMPFFREGYHFDERDRQNLMEFESRGAMDSIGATEVISHIYDDTVQLIQGAEVVAERMRMQLIAPTDGKPKISIVSNGVTYAYDYDPDTSYYTNNFLDISGTAANKWSASTTASPLTDLKDAMDTIETTYGTRPSIAVMSLATFKDLSACDQLKDAILAQNMTANIFITDSLVMNTVSALLGLTIVVYTKKFKTADGTTTAFMPDNIVSLLPEGELGNTYYGTTPEEADLMYSNVNADVAIVSTGVAITTVHTAHPVSIDTYASAIVLPSYERMLETAVLKVG